MNPENPPHQNASVHSQAGVTNGGLHQSAVQNGDVNNIAKSESHMGLAPQPEDDSGAVVSDDDDYDRQFNGSNRSNLR